MMTGLPLSSKLLWKGAKTRFFPVLQRGNSTADPPDIQSPSFQACQVLLLHALLLLNPTNDASFLLHAHMRHPQTLMTSQINESQAVFMQVPLVWWPWWPFNPADMYLNSVLPLERMIREGVIEDTVQLVPVLDGLRPPRFHQWWFAPFSQLPVCSNFAPPRFALIQIHH